MKLTRLDTADYAADVKIEAPRQRVLDALTTRDGFAGWWTAEVQGETRAGGEVELGFTGTARSDQIVLRVDRSDASHVAWTCLAHSAFPDWIQTQIIFDLNEPDGDATTLLEFRHIGLGPHLDCFDVCGPG